MLIFQPMQFNFIRLMLRLFLQSTRPRRQLILLLPRFRSYIKRQLTHRRHIINYPAQLIQLLANTIQFPRVRCQIVTVTLARLATVFDAAHCTIRAENRIGDLVQDVRILHFWFHNQTLAFGTFRLDVVLPEVAFFFVGGWGAAGAVVVAFFVWVA